MRIKGTIREEKHYITKKDEKEELSGVYSEEEQGDPTVKISLVTSERTVSLGWLGFKDF